MPDNTKKNSKFFDKALFVLFATTIIFIITILVIFCCKGAYPEVLVQCYFNSVFGEAGIMGIITALKNFTNRKNVVETIDNEYEEHEGGMQC